MGRRTLEGVTTVREEEFRTTFRPRAARAADVTPRATAPAFEAVAVVFGCETPALTSGLLARLGLTGHDLRRTPAGVNESPRVRRPIDASGSIDASDCGETHPSPALPREARRAERTISTYAIRLALGKFHAGPVAPALQLMFKAADPVTNH